LQRSCLSGLSLFCHILSILSTAASV